jgi:hypothetical protein
MIYTYVLRTADRDAGDALDLLETQADQSLARLALSTRLDLVERSGRSRVIVVVVMIVIMLVVVSVVDLLDSG